jgi:hypothetical protein
MILTKMNAIAETYLGESMPRDALGPNRLYVIFDKVGVEGRGSDLWHPNRVFYEYVMQACTHTSRIHIVCMHACVCMMLNLQRRSL